MNTLKHFHNELFCSLLSPRIRINVDFLNANALVLETFFHGLAIDCNEGKSLKCIPMSLGYELDCDYENRCSFFCKCKNFLSSLKGTGL